VVAFLIRLIFGPFNPTQRGPNHPTLTVRMIRTDGVYICDGCNKVISENETCYNFRRRQLCGKCYSKTLRIINRMSFINKLIGNSGPVQEPPHWYEYIPTCEDCKVELADTEVEDKLVCPKCGRYYVIDFEPDPELKRRLIEKCMKDRKK